MTVQGVNTNGTAPAGSSAQSQQELEQKARDALMKTIMQPVMNKAISNIQKGGQNFASKLKGEET